MNTVKNHVQNNNTIYDKSISLSQSAYELFAEHRALCTGFTKAFQLFMRRLLVPTYFVGGLGDSQSHSWNMIKLDDKYYNIDTTWSQAKSGDVVTEVRYDYYLKSDQTLAKDHTRTHAANQYGLALPSCNEDRAVTHPGIPDKTVTIGNSLLTKIENKCAEKSLSFCDPVTTKDAYYHHLISVLESQNITDSSEFEFDEYVFVKGIPLITYIYTASQIQQAEYFQKLGADKYLVYHDTLTPQAHELIDDDIYLVRLTHKYHK